MAERIDYLDGQLVGLAASLDAIHELSKAYSSSCWKAEKTAEKWHVPKEATAGSWSQFDDLRRSFRAGVQSRFHEADELVGKGQLKDAARMAGEVDADTTRICTEWDEKWKSARQAVIHRALAKARNRRVLRIATLALVIGGAVSGLVYVIVQNAEPLWEAIKGIVACGSALLVLGALGAWADDSK